MQMVVALAAFASLAVVLAACTPPAVPPQPTRTPVKLKVVSLPYLSFAPFYIAQQEGYFAEQGLEVELVQFTRPAETVPALIRGDVDVNAGVLSAGILNAMLRGANIKFVADKGNYAEQGCSYGAILVRRDLFESGALNEASDFKGKHVVTDVDGLQGFIIETYLQPAGLTLADIDAVQIPTAALLETARNHAVDAMLVVEPTKTQLLESGEMVLLADAKDLLPNGQFSGLLFGPNLLEKNPDVGRRFMTAYLKAVRRYNEGKSKRNLDLLAQYSGLDRKLIEESCWASIRSNGAIDLTTTLALQDWLVKKELAEKSLPPEKLWTSEFIDYANQTLDTSK